MISLWIRRLPLEICEFDMKKNLVLLDGFVDYVLSDGFNPEGEVALTFSEGR